MVGCTLKDYAQYDLSDSDSSKVINMFFFIQVSGLVEKINNGIYSDIINVSLFFIFADVHKR